MSGFLPICKKDLQERGIEQLDFVYISGDAYVDHPSFGPAIITRLLERFGYSVGILAQPDWKKKESIMELGEPRLGFLVSAGNMDSMVNHYTVNKKRRSTDAFSPNGEMGLRPDRATICYCNLIRQVYKKTPIIIGGIEASLRRLAHYDYWDNKVRRSVLLDSGADLLIYGMGEHAIIEIAQALESGIAVKDIVYVKGTVYKEKSLENVYDYVKLPTFAEITADKEAYARSFYQQYQNTDSITGRVLVEEYKPHEYIVQNPPAEPLTMQEMDDVYALPYMRTYHPVYEEKGGIPAIQEVKFSITSNRGCFGGCSFCALTFHQGRRIQVRSHESILEEAKQLTCMPDFKGYIHDVGGPTADFRHTACEKQITKGVCQNRQCLFPAPCPNLNADHSDYIALLRKLRNLPKVKKVFVRSGIRFDYVLAEKNNQFLKELCQYHVSGQLKVAPEHVSDNVLALMGKPKHQVFLDFSKKYEKCNKELNLKQYMVPYLMSSHPGSALEDAIELALYLKQLGYMPEQVQDFYPTPATISTCMYYTGLDPRTMKKVYVPKSSDEKKMQRALIQYSNPANYDLVYKALTLAGRRDLIGFSQDCLIPPRNLHAKSGKAKQERMGDNKKGNKQKSKDSISQNKNTGRKKKTIRSQKKRKS